MSSKENREDPIWHTDGGGNDEFINGYTAPCSACKIDTHHTSTGDCSYCLEVKERRRQFWRDTRDNDWYYFER